MQNIVVQSIKIIIEEIVTTVRTTYCYLVLSTHI